MLQTAVKQSRLECVTACNTALGQARCLLPLKTECKEIINRFEFSAEQQEEVVVVVVGGSRRLCLAEKERERGREEAFRQNVLDGAIIFILPSNY